MLPCNVIVQQKRNNEVEVAAIELIAWMQAVKNLKLLAVAEVIQSKLKNAIENL